MNELNQKTIGVVIPTYNRANILRATLDAVLSQTRKPDAVVVVDDGSTDHTDAVLSEYSDEVRSVRIINSGDLVARNIGLANIGTDLVAFCDSDDIWRKNFLSRMEEFWMAEPDLKVAYSDFVIINDWKWEEKTKLGDAPDGFWSGFRHVTQTMGVFDEPIVDRLLHYQPLFPSCMVVDRKFFHSLGGWDEGANRLRGSDFATALLLAEVCSVGIIKEPLVGIRKHAGNFSGDVQKMNLGDALVLEHVLETRPSLAKHAGAIRGSVVKRRQQALDTAFARGDLSAVRQIYNLLPDYARGGAIRVKYTVAAMPGPLGPTMAAILTSAGSAKSRTKKRG